jgi:putative membrane protein
MKSSKSNSFPHARRALIASAAVILLGAVPTFAQSGGAGSTTYGSSQKNPPTTSSGTTGTNANEPARRNNQPAVNADAAATQEINAQTAARTGAMTGRDKLAWGDRRFVTKAADAGTDEVNMAQLAAERASNAEVRDFAQKLVSDHQQVNAELTQIAAQKNVKLDVDTDKDRAYKRLNKKSGSEFEQEFVEHMIDEHEKAIKLFEKASTDAKDPDVRSFAAKHVDHLRDHLRQAQNLRQTVMPTGRSDDSSGRSTPGGTTGSGLGTPSTGKSTTGSSSTDASSTGSSTTPRRDGPR